MSTPGPSRPAKKNKAKITKTPWQTHGGALFDHLSAAALDRLKTRLGLNTEENYADVALSTTLTATMATRMTPPTIPQGVGVGSRVGVSLRVKRIEFRACIAPAPTQTAPNCVRVILTRNVEPGQASAANVVQTTTDISSPINHQAADLGIQVLYDRTFTVGLAANGAQWVQFTIRDTEFPTMHMIWPDTDTAGTPGALNEGCINVYACVDAVNTAAPIVTGRVRIAYVDN